MFGSTVVSGGQHPLVIQLRFQLFRGQLDAARVIVCHRHRYGGTALHLCRCIDTPWQGDMDMAMSGTGKLNSVSVGLMSRPAPHLLVPAARYALVQFWAVWRLL